MSTTPDQLLARLAELLTGTLGNRLRSLAVHGSYVAGDFLAGRSDLDLVGVISGELDEEDLHRLTRVHDQLVAEAPQWHDHVEVDYITAELVAAVMDDADSHSMIRVSPGEPIHRLPATRHYVINWASALHHDHPIAGASPRAVLPEIPDRAVQDVILGHVANWPTWVRESTSPGFQAYAVLALCRADALLTTGRQFSKRAAANRALDDWPDQAELISWARDWWYSGGADDAPARTTEVINFVESMSARLLRSAGRAPDT